MSQTTWDASEGDWQLAGQLLIATTALISEPFAQSVVLMCAHSAEEGAMGIVINRRLAEPGVENLLGQLGIEPTTPRRHIELCAGGPCDTSRGFVLHSSDWQGDGSLIVDETMSLTASLDVLKALAEGEGPKRALLALGHAAWQPGQLEREMEENSWITAPSTVEIVFDRDHDTKWRRALGTLRIEPILLSGRAGHA
jgi:putative transcriptional regulator